MMNLKELEETIKHLDKEANKALNKGNYKKFEELSAQAQELDLQIGLKKHSETI